MLPVLAFVGAIVLFFVAVAINYRDHAIGTRRRPDLQANPVWPVIGNLIDMSDDKRMLERAYETMRKYGAGYTITLPFRRMIDVSRPDWLEHMQKTNFYSYVKGELLQRTGWDTFGRGIFSMDGDIWHYQRKVVSQIFSVRNFKSAISASVNDELAAFVEILRIAASKPGEIPVKDVPLYKLLHDFTLDAFGRMAFSQNFGLLEEQTGRGFRAPEVAAAFPPALDYAQNVFSSRFRNPLWEWSEPFTKQGRMMKKSVATVNRFVYDVIRKRMQERNAKGLKPGDADQNRSERDLLGWFMSTRDENGSPLDETQLRDMVINLLIAGRDTTAQALSWIFFHIITKPHLVAPMVEEIDRILGNQEVTYENYRDLVQVMAFFHEGLRLHPSVPTDVKVAVAHDQMPNGGPRIEPGDCVMWADWVLARDPSIWGDDCEEFKPSRWLETGEDGQVQFKQASQWKFHAFNGGPRICLGQTLATFEAVAVLATLLRSFKFSFPPGWWEASPKVVGMPGYELLEQTPAVQASVTLQMRVPLMVRVESRH